MCASVDREMILSVYLSVYLYLSVHLSICLSAHLFARDSIIMAQIHIRQRCALCKRTDEQLQSGFVLARHIVAGQVN